MTPRHAVLLLGLCNLVAGALVAWAPGLLMSGTDGLGSTGGRLLGRSLGVMLAGTGVGALVMPDGAARPYLWLFGVVVKLAGAMVWGTAAARSGISILWAGAALDLVVATLVGASLLRRSRPG